MKAEEPLPVTISVTLSRQFSPLFFILDGNAGRIGQKRTDLLKTYTGFESILCLQFFLLCIFYAFILFEGRYMIVEAWMPLSLCR